MNGQWTAASPRNDRVNHDLASPRPARLERLERMEGRSAGLRRHPKAGVVRSNRIGGAASSQVTPGGFLVGTVVRGQ